jgi:transcriptional regulator with XRE-family HTH domain
VSIPLKNIYGGIILSIFSERLKDTRLKNKISQKQIAQDIGISESLYQYYEYDKREPSIGNFAKLCEYFNISADYLLGFSNDPTRH